MKKMLISLALASAAIVSTAAAPVAAQTLPPAVIVIVNLDQVFADSAAGKTALAELKARADGIQSRLATLRTSFGTEGENLEKTRPAPTATAPIIAAWEAKARDWQTRKTQAEQELQKRDQDLQLSRQYVVKQLNDGVQPLISTIMRERGASIVLAEGATLQHAAALDVTADVIARLDKALPRVATMPPPAPATK